MSKETDSIDKIDKQLEKLKTTKENKKEISNKKEPSAKSENTKKLDKADDASKIAKTSTKIFGKEIKTIEKDETFEDISKTKTIRLESNSNLSMKKDNELNETTNEFNFTNKDNLNIEDKVNNINTKDKNVTKLESSSDDDDNMSNTFVDKNSFDYIIDNKSKKEKVIIVLLIIAVIVSILGLVGFLILTKPEEKKPSVKVEVELKEEDKEKIINSFGKQIEKVVSDEIRLNSNLLEYEEALKLIDIKENVKCHKHEIYNDGTIYLNKCSINGIMTKYSYGEKKNIINYNVKVYVDKDSLKATLNKPSASKIGLYEVYEVDCGGMASNTFLLGEYLVYNDNSDITHMVNYKTNIKALNNLNYNEILPIKLGDNSYDSNYVIVKVGDFYGVYQLSGEQIISPMYSNIVSNTSSTGNKRNSVSTIYGNMVIAFDGANFGVIDYMSTKTIIPFEFKEIVFSNNNIIGIDASKKGRIFDLLGKEYLIGSNVIGSVDGYYMILDDNKVTLSLIDGKKLYDYDIIDNIGKYFSSKVNNGIVIFQFLDSNTNGKCIEFIYNVNDNSGSYTRDKACGIN